MKQKIPGRGFGITSMVLGIIAAVASLGSIGNCVDFRDEFADQGSRETLDEFAKIHEKLTGEVSDFAVESSSNVSAIVGIFILSALALIFGIVSLAKGFKKGQSISGVILSSVAIVACVIGIVILFSF